MCKCCIGLPLLCFWYVKQFCNFLLPDCDCTHHIVISKLYICQSLHQNAFHHSSSLLPHFLWMFPFSAHRSPASQWELTWHLEIIPIWGHAVVRRPAISWCLLLFLPVCGHSHKLQCSYRLMSSSSRVPEYIAMATGCSCVVCSDDWIVSRPLLCQTVDEEPDAVFVWVSNVFGIWPSRWVWWLPNWYSKDVSGINS